MSFTLRPAGLDDLAALVDLEARCFSYDRLSRRNFHYMLTRANAVLILAENDRSWRATPWCCSTRTPRWRGSIP